MNIFNTLRGFAASLTPSERTGAGYYLLALLAVLVLLTSCTQETYIEDLEPVAQVESYTESYTGPGLLDDLEPTIEYDVEVYCNSFLPESWTVVFTEQNTMTLCEVLDSGALGNCGTFDFTTTDSTLSMSFNGNWLMDFTPDGEGNLAGLNALGCVCVIRG